MNRPITIAFGILLTLWIISGAAFAQEEKTTEFTEITGRVVDSNNKPVKKFKVNILIYDYSEGGWQKTPKTLETWDEEFEDGVFKFDVKKPIPINDMTYVSRTITADGYLDQNRNNGFVMLKTFSGKLGAIKLARGVKVKGKVILPDNHADEQPLQPKVFVSKVSSGLSPDWNNMFQAPCTVSEEGTFEKTVPENCTIMVTCSADNAATSAHEFKIKKAESLEDEEDFGELKLKQGVVISGIVLDRDGEPVEGQIVQHQQNVKNRSHVSSFVYGYAMSDEDGKFTLPPREGKGEISLAETGRINGKQVSIKGKPLMVKPINLTVKEGQPVAELEIREGAAHKIHGVIQFKGEKPTVYFSYGQSNQSQMKVNDDGTFEISIAEGVEPWMIIQKWEENFQMAARMSKESQREFGKYFSSSVSGDRFYFQLKKVKTEIGPLEFKMVKQIRDDRSMVDRFIDWFYYGDE